MAALRRSRGLPVAAAGCIQTRGTSFGFSLSTDLTGGPLGPPSGFRTFQFSGDCTSKRENSRSGLFVFAVLNFEAHLLAIVLRRDVLTHVLEGVSRILVLVAQEADGNEQFLQVRDREP